LLNCDTEIFLDNKTGGIKPLTRALIEVFVDACKNIMTNAFVLLSRLARVLFLFFEAAAACMHKLSVSRKGGEGHKNIVRHTARLET